MNKKDLSLEHEKYIEKKFAYDIANRSRSSGAFFGDPIDVTSSNYVIECEATEKKSKSFKKDLWFEVRMKSYADKTPLLAIRFADPNPRHQVDLIIMDIEEFLYRDKLIMELKETIKKLENGCD